MARMILSAISFLALVFCGSNAQTNPCSCKGAVVNDVCYANLSAAIDASANASAPVQIGGKLILTKPIIVKGKSFSLEGINCGSKATIAGKMNAGEGGMIEAYGPGQLSLSFKDIIFTREPGSGPVAAFRGGVFKEKDTHGHDVKGIVYDDVKGPKIKMNISGCEFRNLLTNARGGSAIYIMRPSQLSMTNSVFDSNVVERPSKPRYGGGGVLWLSEVAPSSDVTIQCSWSNNIHKFQHGLGGAIMLEKVRGKVSIDGEYVKNSASDGGAVHVFRSEPGSIIDIKGKYDSNEAKEYGWGSRGGALRIQNVLGMVNVDGTYTNNKAAGGRGGVLAINRMYAGGHMILKGKYTNNFALNTGGVFDQVSGSDGYGYVYVFEPNSTITFDGSCTFQGNKAQVAPSTSIINIAPLNVQIASWNGQTVTFDASSMSKS